MPIVWGVNATKVYVAVWLIVLLSVLIVVMVYILQFQWWLPVAYGIATILFPLVVVLVKLKKSVTVQHFHQLSTITKLVMLTGILSMIFFYFYI
jgi:4-hydroxybenzoate polyprenyltransferase